MSTSAQRPPSRTQIADLRAGLRAARGKPAFEKPPPAPKRPKKAPVDLATERAEKAERRSHQQHTTSLLTGKVAKPYVRKGERPQSRGTVLGLLIQITFVIGLVGGVAWALDPSLAPPEWNDKASELINHVKSNDIVRQWLPA